MQETGCALVIRSCFKRAPKRAVHKIAEPPRPAVSAAAAPGFVTGSCPAGCPLPAPAPAPSRGRCGCAWVGSCFVSGCAAAAGCGTCGEWGQAGGGKLAIVPCSGQAACQSHLAPLRLATSNSVPQLAPPTQPPLAHLLLRLLRCGLRDRRPSRSRSLSLSRSLCDRPRCGLLALPLSRLAEGGSAGGEGRGGSVAG